MAEIKFKEKEYKIFFEYAKNRIAEGHRGDKFVAQYLATHVSARKSMESKKKKK